MLGDDDSSSPVRYTDVFSHVELNLTVDWLSIIVVFEFQAHVATLLMHVLNLSFCILDFQLVLSRV